MKKKITLRNEFRILAIGNSFSENAFRYLYPVLKSFGVRKIVLGNLIIGGCSIERHYNNLINNVPDYLYRKNVRGVEENYSNFQLIDALKDEKWDYITMQQASHDSGLLDTYQLVMSLKEKIQDIINDEKVQYGWHMTWAYQKNSNHPAFINYQKNQKTMYRAILNCVKQNIMVNNNFDFLIPAATAIQNARTSYLGDSLTCCDGFHLEPLGEFIVGLTYVMAITGWPAAEMDDEAVPLWFKPYLPVVKEAVTNAILHPFKVTKSVYQKNPLDLYAVDDEKKYEIISNLVYQEDHSDTKLDLYLPKTDFTDVVIHFHGGGLTSGQKDDDAHQKMGKMLASNNVAFSSVGYPLYPNAKYPDDIIYLAQAIKYIVNYFNKLGKKFRFFISGQSAGAYLAMMLAFNSKYLIEEGLKVDDITGWIIESGQPTTHFNILATNGLDPDLIRVDEAAPLYYINKDTNFKHLLLIAYTNDINGRLAQNELTYQTILNQNNNLDIKFKILVGTHCLYSTTSYRSIYSYGLLLLDYLHKIK